MTLREAAGEAGRSLAETRRRLFRRIGDFMAAHQLEPTPANYAVAHCFVTASNSEVVAAIRQATSDGLRLSQQYVDEMWTKLSGHVPMGGVKAALNQIVSSIDDARGRFERYAGIVDATHADARAYGVALADGAARLTPMEAAGPANALATLIAVTESMIEKTRTAESQLRTASQEMTDLRASLAAARQDADTDALTGLPNRRSFEARFAERMAEGGKRAISLAMCDIDLFKAINDRHGHDVGDRVIRLVGRELTAGCAEGIVARYGGEEFAILFDGIDVEEAMRCLDDTRAAIARRSFRVTGTDATLRDLSFSGGVIAVHPGEPVRDAARRADAALYRAKQAGRNRIERGD